MPLRTYILESDFYLFLNNLYFDRRIGRKLGENINPRLRLQVEISGNKTINIH